MCAILKIKLIINKSVMRWAARQGPDRVSSVSFSQYPFSQNIPISMNNSIRSIGFRQRNSGRTRIEPSGRSRLGKEGAFQRDGRDTADNISIFI